MWQPRWQQADVERKSSEVAFEGHYKVVKHTLRYRQFDGSWGPWVVREQILRRPAGVLVLFDPVRRAFVLIEQCRMGLIGDTQYSPWMLECVAGIIDEGESAADTLRREALEEAGCVVTSIHRMMQCHPTPGGFSEYTHLYYAAVDSRTVGGTHGLAEEGEDILVHVVPEQDVITLIEQGMITSATTILAIQWVLLNRQALPV